MKRRKQAVFNVRSRSLDREASRAAAFRLPILCLIQFQIQVSLEKWSASKQFSLESKWYNMLYLEHKGPFPSQFFQKRMDILSHTLRHKEDDEIISRACKVEEEEIIEDKLPLLLQPFKSKLASSS
ncbi:hypothetical protein Tco_1193469 [Tanacetum coccineum]